MKLLNRKAIYILKISSWIGQEYTVFNMDKIQVSSEIWSSTTGIQRDISYLMNNAN